MHQKISILGCGWLGFPLAKHLMSKGFEVFGSTTSREKIALLNESGIQAFLVDISEYQQDLSNFLASDLLVISITSKNIADIEQLIVRIENSGIQKVIFISSTSVYSNTNEIVTETTATNQSPLAEIEQLFIANRNFQTTILRFGGLIGYDRQPGNFVRADKAIEDPEGFVNMIHRDDCIAVIEQIIQKDVWNEVFNACADTHPTRRAFYAKEAAKLGKHSLVFNENSNNDYKIISSEKLKKQFGFQFKYGDLMIIY